MAYEYLTVEYALKKNGPLLFRFADDSSVQANHLQEFLNRQAALGWQLLAAVPLSYAFFKPPGGEGNLLLNCCRLIFQHQSAANSDNANIEPQPGAGPGRRLQPV